MKTLFSISLLLVLSYTSYSQSQGQFRIRNDAFIQLGYNNYKTLTFGNGLNTPNNGQFGIEYCDQCLDASNKEVQGLNIWRPWPTENAGNNFIFIRNEGQVGIGMIPETDYKLDVNGTIRCLGLTNLSDERLKTNFKSIKSTIEPLKQLKVYNYQFKPVSSEKLTDSLNVNVKKQGQKRNVDAEFHYGFKAQELMKIFPELVKQDSNGIYAVNYIEIIPLLVSAIQEQQAKIEALEKKIK